MKVNDLKMDKQTLVVLSGNIGLGKTTLANELVPMGFVSISIDSIADSLTAGRKELLQGAIFSKLCRKIYDGSIYDALSLGLSVVADDLNLRSSRRKMLCSMAREFGARSLSIDFGAGTDEGMFRRAAESDRLNQQGWEFMYLDLKSKYQKPSLAEGFSLLINKEVITDG